MPRSVLFCKFIVQFLHVKSQVFAKIWLIFDLFIIVGVFLDAEQKGIVHEVELSQHSDVTYHRCHDSIAVFLREIKPGFLAMFTVQLQQVLVFKCSCWWRVFFYNSFHSWTFQVKYIHNITCLFHWVAHDNQLNRSFVFHNDAVDAIDPGKQAVFVSTYSLEISFLNALECFKVTICHRLDNKVLVLAEEKETSTLALRLSSLENRIFVVVWQQTLPQHWVVVAVSSPKESKNIRAVLNHVNILVNNKFTVKWIAELSLLLRW